MTKTLPTATPKAISEPKLPDPTLVADIADWVRQYVVLPSHEHGFVLALWVIDTWTCDLFDTTPYIYLNSAEPRCGKTRTIETLELLVRNPLRAAGATPAALIRAIERIKPTLLLDEADTIWRPGARNELLRGIVNDGYKRGGSFLRMQQNEPKKFSTYGPKLFAGIFNAYLPETMIDRSIPIKLKRKAAHENAEPFHLKSIRASLEYNSLLDRIESFLEEWSAAVAIQRPEPIRSINDRQWEITEPLVAIATVLGVEDEAREAIELMFDEAKSEPSVQASLLADIQRAFGSEPKMFSAALLERLSEIEANRSGRTSMWNGKLLAHWLAPYGIQAAQIRIGNQTGHGFKAADFEQAWNAL